MHDLVIRGGTVVDGTGRPAHRADVAVDGGVIRAIGDLRGEAAREVLDADGLLVTPGFIDVHTHFDGQATWDAVLRPASVHGATTVVMGNCGVGFAPVAPARRQWLCELMEGVEDIPGTALMDGITWEWETFPEYLDALDRLPRTVDVAAQLTHGALRAYVMGDRSQTDDATPDDITAMTAILRESLRAGAVGFSSNRFPRHLGKDGRAVPGTFATDEEFLALAGALGDVGRGVFQLVHAGHMGDTPEQAGQEFAIMRRAAEVSGRPVSYLLGQAHRLPLAWRDLLRWSHEAADRGVRVVPQSVNRGTGVIMSLRSSHPFQGRPSYDALAALPLPERVSRLRDPRVRAAILAETSPIHFSNLLHRELDKIFPLGDDPDYEPAPADSVAAAAARLGVDPLAHLYDLLLERDGDGMLLFPMVNYADGNLDIVGELMRDPMVVLGGGDAGAHCLAICDSSITTYMLTHWARDRERGGLPVEAAVAKMTSKAADLYGFADRGRLRPGLRADINVIDLDTLRLHRPEVVYDLPTGAGRLLQRADGYVATVLAGQVTFRAGEETGARPGRLVRAA